MFEVIKTRQGNEVSVGWQSGHGIVSVKSGDKILAVHLAADEFKDFIDAARAVFESK